MLPRLREELWQLILELPRPPRQMPSILRKKIADLPAWRSQSGIDAFPSYRCCQDRRCFF